MSLATRLHLEQTLLKLALLIAGVQLGHDGMQHIRLFQNDASHGLQTQPLQPFGQGQHRLAGKRTMAARPMVPIEMKLVDLDRAKRPGISRTQVTDKPHPFLQALIDVTDKRTTAT